MNEFTLDINVNSKRWLNPNYLTRLLPCSQIPTLYYNDSYVFNLNLYNEDLTPYVIPENPTIVFAGDVNRDHSDCLMLYVTGSEIEVIDAEQGKLRLTFQCWRESFYNKAGCDMIVNLKINDSTVLEDRLFAKVGAYSGEIPGGDGCITNYNDLEDRPKINGVTLEGDKTSEELNITQVQSDWDESDSSEPSYIRNKPTHFEQVQADWEESDSAAADYIKNKPVIPDPQVQADWDQSDSTAVDYIQNKPVIPEPVPQVQSDWDESDSEAVSYILNKPVIPEPVSQEQADWDESDSSAVDYIKNKPIIPEPIPQVQSDWDESDSAAVDYIKNKPVIPEPVPQEQADWDESDSSDVAYIQNKPDLSVYMPKAGGTFTGDVDVNGILRLELGKSLVLRSQNAQATGYSSIVVGTSDNYANYALCIGIANKLYGQAGIAAGTNCNVAQNYAYAFGVGNRTSLSAQTVVGQYNDPDSDAYLVVGNGTADSSRSNAFVIKTTGDAVLAGDLTFTPAGGTSTTLSNVIASIPAAQVQSDWDESDSSDTSYIQNKPDLSQYALASNVLSLEGGTLTGTLTISRDTVPRPQIELVFNGTTGFLVNNNKLQLGGNHTTSDNYGSVAIGYQNASTGGFGCMTLGRGLNNTINSSLVVGEYNAADTEYVFICANGTSTSERANAFVVKKSGDAALSGDLTFTPAGGSPTTLSDVIASIPAAQVQSDWDESDSSDTSYIQNKPDLSQYALTANTVLKTGSDLTGGLVFNYNSFDALISGKINDTVYTVLKPGSLILGAGSTTTASTGSLVVGRCEATRGNGCVAIGNSCGNYHESSLVAGIGLSSSASAQCTVGGYNTSDTDARFIVGNGTGTAARSNAFVVKKTGDAVLAGTLTTAGTEIVAATTNIVPQDNKVYQHTLADSDVLTIDTSALTSNHQVSFELHLTQPSSPVAFTLPNNIVWSAGTDFASGNPAPVINSGDTLYCIVLRWTGRRLLGSLAYTEYVGDLSDSDSSSSGV